MARGATIFDYLGNSVDPNGKSLPMVPSKDQKPKVINLRIKEQKKS